MKYIVIKTNFYLNAFNKNMHDPRGFSHHFEDENRRRLVNHGIENHCNTIFYRMDFNVFKI